MSIDINSFLERGFSEDQILKMINKVFPNIAKAVKSAASAGKSTQQIVSMLASMAPNQFNKADKNAERLDFRSPLERANEAAKSQEKNDILKTVNQLGSIALTAASIYGASKVIPTLLGATQSLSAEQPKDQFQSTISQADQSQERTQPIQQDGVSFPSQYAEKISRGALQPSSMSTTGNPPIGQNIGPTPMSNAPFSQNQKQQTLTQPQTLPTQALPQLDLAKSVETVNQMGIGEQIKTLQQAGNTPESIAAAVGISLRPGQKKWLDEQIKSGTAKPLPDMIADYVSQAGQQLTQPQQQPLPQAQVQVQPQQLDQQPQQPQVVENVQKMDEDVEKVEKGSLVSTLDGRMGEVKSIRNGKALIEDEGKLHQVKESDLIQSPLPKKDLAELYEDLISGIEYETKEDVSRNVNWAGYDPNKNELAYLPQDSDLYIYQNISPEDVEILTSILSTRKTSGKNFIGSWIKGTKSPIGASMSALIKKLQAERGGKGNEYSGKFGTIYSSIEPAVRAAKEKKRKGTLQIKHKRDSSQS